jgi:preprotein translocase subunit YajC
MTPAQPSMVEMFLPFIVIFVIFYFLIIRPQGKRLKTHEKFVTELKRGDSIITSSGIIGTIDSLNDTIATIEVDAGVRLKVLRKQIAASTASLQTAEKKS